MPNRLPLIIHSEAFQEAWLYLLEELINRYDHTPAPRGMKTREVTGVLVRISDMRNNVLYHPVRNMNYKFAVAEWLWISLGLDDLSTLTKYNGQMSRFSDDGKTLAGAYGPRLKAQWNYVVENLTKDPVSRQAVATIWSPNPQPSKDIPCTISLQFIARDGKLNLVVTMRSSDVWLGLPYDVFTFANIGNAMAGTLKLEPGYLQMQLGSSHLYEDNLEKAKEVLNDTNRYNGVRFPRLPGWPSDYITPYLRDPNYGALPGHPGHGERIGRPWSDFSLVLAAPSWLSSLEVIKGISEVQFA